MHHRLPRRSSHHATPQTTKLYPPSTHIANGVLVYIVCIVIFIPPVRRFAFVAQSQTMTNERNRYRRRTSRKTNSPCRLIAVNNVGVLSTTAIPASSTVDEDVTSGFLRFLFTGSGLGFRWGKKRISRRVK
jgi:hypothetical protein